MHNNKLVVALKTKGKVLREFKDQIKIPFGTEFSIYLKNLNSVRASVKIEIDGKDIGNGEHFIVPTNGDVEIERYLSDNLNQGNRFKFIERTVNIENNRGIGAEDGLIRVEFQFEKVGFDFVKIFNELKKTEVHHHHYHNDWDVGSSPLIGTPYNGDNTYGGYKKYLGSTHSVLRGAGSPSYSGGSTCDSNPIGSTTNYTNYAENDAGITVPGSISNQQFEKIQSFPVEDEKHIIVLNLIGELKTGEKITSPITVKSKPKCVTCNRTNKAYAKFCVECGTSLIIV